MARRASTMSEAESNMRRNSDSLGSVRSHTPLQPPRNGVSKTITPSTERPSWFVIQVTMIASLGGILFGYDLGVISAALPQLITEFDLSNSEKEAIVSVLYVGGGIGASLGGSLCDAAGRKRAILYCDFFFGLGALLLFVAPNLVVLMLGRVVVGFAVAVSGIADVSYLHEIAPVRYRGAIVSVNEACISLGFLFAFGVGTALEDAHEGWRYMFGVSGLLALVQFFGMWSMPESPKWLQDKGRVEEAEEALRRISPSYSSVASSWIELEHDGLTNRTISEEKVSASNANYLATATSIQPPSSNGGSSDDLSDDFVAIDSPATNATTPTVSSTVIYLSFCRSFQQIAFLCKQLRTFASKVYTDYRKQAYVTLFLSIFQQLSGQTNVLSYAPLIFAAANGNNNVSSSSSTLLIGVVKFIVTVLVIWKIERLGRRCLLLTGIGIVCTGLLLLAAAFVETNETDGKAVTPEYAGLALPGVLLVVCGYSMSFGPLTWLLTSELFPTDIRGRALGASTIVTYLMASLVTYTFLSMQEWLGPSIVFTLYFLASAGGLVFSALAICDTGGKTSQEIEQDLSNMMWWRGNDHVLLASPRNGRSSITRFTSADKEPPLQRFEAVLS